MCGGVQFDSNGLTIKIFFPNPKAWLPVLTRQDDLIQIPRGRREQQPGQTPLGGWTRLDSIRTGVWERFQPRPGKIIIDALWIIMPHPASTLLQLRIFSASDLAR